MASNCWQDKRIVRHIIDVGTEVNSNTGDFVRVGFSKTKKNFEDLEDSLNRLELCQCLANVLVTPLVCPEVPQIEKTYSITPNTTSVNLEVSTSVRYNVATTNIKNGEILYWTNSGTTSNTNFTDDVDQGTVEINSNVGVIDRNILRESIITEKTIVLELRRASFFSPIVATANLVTISPISISTKLYLDGKNNDSYPETGTTWFDLTENNYDYILSDQIGEEIVGNLWGWGRNDYGQLSTNTTNGVSGPTYGISSPVLTISGTDDWTNVELGKNPHGAGIKTNGSLWTWGLNDSGQLGDNTTTNRSSPVQTVATGTNWKQVDCGSDYSAAIKTDGTLWLWGYNFNGELGDNTNLRRSSPVQTSLGGTNWKQVSCGYNHTAAVKTDGTLWLWGAANVGQLGNNSVSPNKSSPVQTVSTETNWKQVSCGSEFTAAIKTDGTLWLWGSNNWGKLGDNTNGNVKSSPIQTVSGGTNWEFVNCGNDHVAAIKIDGTLWTWGNNGVGQLGDNTSLNRSSPVQTVSGGSNWKRVNCGSSHTAAIKTDGTLWSWGYNLNGQLGDNTGIRKSSPVQTTLGGTNWKQVSAGFDSTIAIRN